MITIAIQSHNFERRLCWMLSSILQQIDPPPITVDLHIMGGDFIDRVARLFIDLAESTENIHITTTKYPDQEQFQYRGLTRTRALRKCFDEWMLFADTDHVYDPCFFNSLAWVLENRYSSYDGMLTTGRMSNEPIEGTNSLINNWVDRHAVVVHDSFDLAKETLEHNLIERRNCGAGYFQLINTMHAPHQDYYVTPQENRDYSWSKFQKANSDKQFRSRIGKKEKLPKRFTTNQIHLNHNRDNMFKKHLEEQR